MPATGVPQFRRLAVGGVLDGAAPALLPESADGHGPDRSPSGGPSRPRAHAEAVLVATFDTVTVALRHGLEAVDILRLRRACGAVLQSRNGATVSFLVPPGTSATWHLPGSSCTAGAQLLPATDPRWVMPPAGADCATRPTDPWVLRSALCEAACTLTAGGLGPS
ncbi:hypothetical protein GCM10009639_37420 [Kitasatospora putterlickiae]|uniref:Uncharacterized protein n=1 Tax=Kitasatospora putterlickiae TaxID=221725 RepID=A0ABN1Y5U7_9ACTN